MLRTPRGELRIDEQASDEEGKTDDERQALLGVKGQADAGDAAEHDGGHGYEREPGCAVGKLVERATLFKPALAEVDVRETDRHPDDHDREAAEGREEDEDRIGRHDRGDERGPAAQHRNDERRDGKPVFALLREGFGKHAVLRERPEHAPACEEVGVGSGDDGRENHEVEDACGVRDAESLEDRNEGALEDRRFFGRKKRCENDDRTDEKDDEAHHGRANRHRDDALRVFRFTRRDPDEFRTREGEEDGHHGRHHREDAVREGARFGEVLEVRGGRAVGKRQDAEDGETAQDDEDLNRHHLDEREDEFAFGKKSTRKDVHAENKHAEDETPEPDRRVGEPVLHGKARAEKGRPDADGAGEPIEPRDGKAHARGNVL